MNKDTRNKEDIKLNGYFRINLGVVIILASPLLGVLLEYIINLVVGELVSNDIANIVLLATSILSVLTVGILEVVIGIVEKLKHDINKK
ncbi:hypothetical protein [Clostridium manihotivorum]|uniref:Uncharacterized protein n=1 Tax=Clostridium manihotivorum TaxID=2320868 RepID=A0A3R5QTY7_9CLOT|nr:hypothetical protein [Clostridium manihotivorum]QAA32551.1 hypothetical protein C1I91_13415 [Clostridium manihotivorum]